MYIRLFDMWITHETIETLNKVQMNSNIFTRKPENLFDIF